MAKTKLRFIDRLDDVEDHILFIVIFLLGVIPVGVFRLFTNTPAWASAAWLLSLMGLYLALIVKTKRYRLREDRSADNLYFLGFLFTVGALLISLIKFSWDVGGDALANNPLVVVGDLGVGLLTTLAGLFLRVVLTQVRKDPEEIEDRVRLQLTVAAENTRDQILQATSLVEDSNVLMKQIMEESQLRLNDFTNTLIKSVDELTNRVNRISIPEDLISAKLDPSLSQATESLSNFSQRTIEIEIPQDLLVSRADSAFQGLETAAKNSVETAIANVALNTKLELEKQLERLGKEAAVLVGNIEVPDDLVEKKLEPMIGQLSEQFEIMNQKLSQETTTLVSQVQNTLSIFKELEDSAVLNGGVIRDRFSEVREQIDQNLSDVGTRFARNLETATVEIGEASATYQRKSIEAFRGFDQRLQAPLGTINARIAEASESFEILSNKIIETNKTLETLGAQIAKDTGTNDNNEYGEA